jgi:hypothetical protein
MTRSEATKFLASYTEKSQICRDGFNAFTRANREAKKARDAAKPKAPRVHVAPEVFGKCRCGYCQGNRKKLSALKKAAPVGAVQLQNQI